MSKVDKDKDGEKKRFTKKEEERDAKKEREERDYIKRVLDKE